MKSKQKTPVEQFAAACDAVERAGGGALTEELRALKQTLERYVQAMQRRAVRAETDNRRLKRKVNHLLRKYKVGPVVDAKVSIDPSINRWNAAWLYRQIAIGEVTVPQGVDVYSFIASKLGMDREVVKATLFGFGEPQPIRDQLEKAARRMACYREGHAWMVFRTGLRRCSRCDEMEKV